MGQGFLNGAFVIKMNFSFLKALRILLLAKGLMTMDYNDTVQKVFVHNPNEAIFLADPLHLLSVFIILIFRNRMKLYKYLLHCKRPQVEQ
jgi:hypothetical protein